MRVSLLFVAAAMTAACAGNETTSPLATANAGGAAGAAGKGGAGGAAGSAGAAGTATLATSKTIDPFIGSGGFAYAAGSSFPGACAPNGLVKLGPDTNGPWATVNFLHYSGYWYGDDRIQGFSHAHLHGTGAIDYGELGVMPLPSFDPSKLTMDAFESTFSKASEHAEPGRYAVTLDNGGIAVELTATPHVAYHRYTWPASSTTGTVLVDLAHHLDGISVDASDVTLSADQQSARGSVHTKGGMSGGFPLYFELRSKTKWTSATTWVDGATPASATKIVGKGGGFALAYATAGAPIELKVGLSLVSADAAAAAIDGEAPDWDFEKVAKATAADWDGILGRLRVAGGTETQRTIFASALYHAFEMPSVHSDADGTFVGPDGKIHQASGFRYVSDLSLWDTYRTLNPLYHLAWPEAARDVTRSLTTFAEIAGFFPKWTVGNVDAGTMIGASAEVVLADAWVKGLHDFDGEAAYQRLHAAATSAVPPPGGRGGRDHVELYDQYGYVPSTVGGSVSWTMEFGADDFALAELAGALGHDADRDALRARSLGYRALFDADHMYLRAKTTAGAWAGPNTNPSAFTNEYVEANGYQSSWAPWDVEGMAMLHGGKEALVAHLEDLFAQTKDDWDNLDPDPTSLKGKAAPRPFYRAGNENGLHIPYLFAQAGRPDLTQKWVRWLLETAYGKGPDGLPGNDDGGTMSAWYVWSALGFYPLAGSDRYIVGAPLFDHAEIDLPGGKLTIDAPGVSATNLYVQSVTLNGAPLTKPELRHGDFATGGALVFTMGPAPSMWGR